MSIRPIDIVGQTMRRQELATQKSNQDAKPFAQQLVIEDDNQKADRRVAQSVNHKDDTDGQESRHDASQKGRNEYQDNRRRDAKAKQEESVKAVKKNTGGGFDIRI